MAKHTLRQFLAKLYDKNVRTKKGLWALKTELEAPIRGIIEYLDKIGVGQLAPKSPPFGIQTTRLPDIDKESVEHASTLVVAITKEDVAENLKEKHGLTLIELRELHHGLVTAVGVPTPEEKG
jgi:hypothetical protein